MNNIYSHLTAKQRQNISFPSKILFERDLLVGKILDFGCGFGKDVEELQNKGLDIVGYDPHYFPNYPTQNFDTIICQYVLNVLDKKEQFKVLVAISQLLNPNGHCYFAVRRDVKYPGFRIHKTHKLPTYQTIVRLPYESIFKNDNCELYDYQRIVDLSNDNKCEFCNPENADFIAESSLCYAIYDKFPVTKGHALVIPKRHVIDFFHLRDLEKMSLWLLAEEVTKNHGSSDFNLGFNIGKYAGQTISHCHLHIIPRYRNDTPEYIGGIRNVIQGKGNYR